MNQSGNPDNILQQELHPYFKKAGLSLNDFDSKYNMTWGNLKFGNYRNCGPKGRTQPYFYPIEWEGYGLNVAKKYGINDNWLMKDNNNEEWCVMYYGTTFESVQGIMQGGRQIMRSSAQAYSDDYCLITKDKDNNPVKIGKGVYLSNHIEVCERSLKQKQIGDQKYIVVLQVRVRPEALRQVKKDTDILDLIVQNKKNNKYYDKSCDNMDLWNNDYFVVNNAEDIRPYRILLRNVTHAQIEFIEFEEEQFEQKEQVDSLEYFKNKENYKIQDPQKPSIQIYQFAILKDLFFEAKTVMEIVTQNKQQVVAQQETFQKQQQQLSVDQGGDILVVCANQINCILSRDIETDTIIDVQNLLEIAIQQLSSSQEFLREKKDLIQILENINQIQKESEKSKSKPIQLAQKELVKPLHFFQNPQNLTKQDPIKQSNEKYQFETECQDLFQQLVKENKLVNPIKLVINQNIDASNLEVLFYVLGDQMRQAGRKFSKSLIPDERLLYSFHGQFAADSNDSQAYTLTLQETPSLTYKAIASDEIVRQKFLNNFRKSVSIDLKVSENQIQIVAIEEGSINVVFEVLDAAGVVHENQNFSELKKNFPDSQPKLKLKEYFKEAALSVDDFDPNYNMTWEYEEFGNYDDRGPNQRPQPYFFPIGWYGYALKIAGRYGKKDNWLMMDGNREEWYVMFHGTDCRGVQGIMQEGRKMKPGRKQAYSEDYCLITANKIGEGVYFSNHIEVCEYYAKYGYPTKIGDKQLIVAFQSRVRPEALRQCPNDTMDYFTSYKDEERAKNCNYNKTLDEEKYWKNSYFVVNNICDIRPYRILLKEL